MMWSFGTYARISVFAPYDMVIFSLERYFVPTPIGPSVSLSIERMWPDPAQSTEEPRSPSNCEHPLGRGVDVDRAFVAQKVVWSWFHIHMRRLPTRYGAIRFNVIAPL